MAAPYYPERGEVIYINHSPAVGSEIPNVHPMLVISEKAYNSRTRMVIGFPMTHATFHHTNRFAIPFPDGTNPDGSVLYGYILCNQVKSFDLEARGCRPYPKMGMKLAGELSRALTILNAIIQVPR